MNIDFLNDISESNRFNVMVVQCKPDLMHEAILSIKKEGLNVINIGSALSEKLKDMQSSKFLAIESQEFIQHLIVNESKPLTNSKQSAVAIYNLGILFEPSLGLDVEAILKDLAKTIAIIILWEHQITPPSTLHWGIQEDKYNLSFSDINLSKVYSYEV